jgi:transposase, IS5 family
MQRQGSCAEVEYGAKKKQTRRDRACPGRPGFLAEMDVVVPRPSPGQALGRLVERLRPLYPKGERGRPPMPLERMLRVYFVQQWYGLSDDGLADALGACPRA